MYFVQFVQSFIIAIQLLQTRQNLTIRLSILEARRFSQSAITFSRWGGDVCKCKTGESVLAGERKAFSDFQRGIDPWDKRGGAAICKTNLTADKRFIVSHTAVLESTYSVRIT